MFSSCFLPQEAELFQSNSFQCWLATFQSKPSFFMRFNGTGRSSFNYAKLCGFNISSLSLVVLVDSRGSLLVVFILLLLFVPKFHWVCLARSSLSHSLQHYSDFSAFGSVSKQTQSSITDCCPISAVGLLPFLMPSFFSKPVSHLFLSLGVTGFSPPCIHLYSLLMTLQSGIKDAITAITIQSYLNPHQCSYSKPLEHWLHRILVLAA